MSGLKQKWKSEWSGRQVDASPWNSWTVRDHIPTKEERLAEAAIRQVRQMLEDIDIANAIYEIKETKRIGWHSQDTRGRPVKISSSMEMCSHKVLNSRRNLPALGSSVSFLSEEERERGKYNQKARYGRYQTRRESRASPPPARRAQLEVMLEHSWEKCMWMLMD